jgi:hypothetical protein
VRSDLIPTNFFPTEHSFYNVHQNSHHIGEKGIRIPSYSQMHKIPKGNLVVSGSLEILKV